MVKACKDFEREAQKQLYLTFADDLMSVAFRYAGDLSSAEDLVQNTFLKVFKTIHQFDDQKGTIGAWMCRILINEALKGFRKQRKTVMISEEIMEQVETETFSIIQKLEAEDILKLLHQLPEGCRIIFNLYVVEGYKHQEIAELLDITASASRSQLTRAKKLLRSLLKESEENISI